MATIVNNPPPRDDSGNFGAGMVIGILVIILAVFLIYWFGFRPNNAVTPTNVNVTVPASNNQNNPQQPVSTFQSTSTTNSTTTIGR